MNKGLEPYDNNHISSKPYLSTLENQSETRMQPPKYDRHLGGSRSALKLHHNNPNLVAARLESQLSSYNLRRHNPAFKNVSRGVSGVLTGGSTEEGHYPMPTKRNQLESIEHKLSKLSHVLDNPSFGL